MRKKIGTLLIVASLGALCAGLAACSDETAIEENFKNGNVISVTYDASGGSIAGGENVKLVDMFNPDKYQADADGYVRIKLRSPTDSTRPKPGVDSIKVTRGEYCLVGWYKTRTPVEVDGSVVDEAGNKLTLGEDGNYYLEKTNSDGEKYQEKTVPAYTFSDPWDFEEDRVSFKKGDEKLDMTLYAAWTEKFSFEYYYKPTDESEWTQFGTTRFDFTDSKKEDSVHVPEWSTETGRMNHRYSSAYTFPSLKDMTFEAAYSDPSCTAETQITKEKPFAHQGSMNYETATAIDPVQKIYVEFMNGNHYRISTPKQFADIGDSTGHYTILESELDFDCKLEKNVLKFGTQWPMGLMISEFTGSIVGEGGIAVTFKNVGAQYNVGSNATVGGLFGSIGKGAVLKDVTFDNAIVEIAMARGRQGGNFGTLAGEIEEGAQIDNVSIGGKLRLGKMNIQVSEKEPLNVHIVANGSTDGITNSGIGLTVFGSEVFGSEKFAFFVNPQTAKLNQDGTVSIDLISEFATTGREFENQYYEISTENGRTKQ